MAHRPAASPPRADTQQASASPPRAGELIPSPRPSPARLSLSPRQAAGSPRTEERPTGEARSAGEERADAQAEGTQADEEPSDDAQRVDQEPADSPLRAQATPSEEAGRPTVEGAATEEPEAAAATFPEVPELSSAGSMRSPIDAQPIRIDASQVIFTSFSSYLFHRLGFTLVRFSGSCLLSAPADVRHGADARHSGGLGPSH